MDQYENLGSIGEGTYGIVIKARHKVTGRIVAIKKFKESDEDEQVRKTALREIRILKQLKHEHVVNLIEVFRRKGKLYLVFEYVEKTILEELERHPNGLDPRDVKRYLYQLCKALEFIHSHNIIHRDIKPENLLVSKNGVLKLCDFGFARSVARPGARYTDYVATRWYRSPELLVGDTNYGKGVDVWAVGCMFAEILNGMPLYPGESDIDQLYHIMKCFGELTPQQMEVFAKNPLYVGIKLPVVRRLESLEQRFLGLDRAALAVLKACLQYEPNERATPAQLLQFPYFAEMRKPAYQAEFARAVERDNEEALGNSRKPGNAAAAAAAASASAAAGAAGTAGGGAGGAGAKGGNGGPNGGGNGNGNGNGKSKKEKKERRNKDKERDGEQRGGGGAPEKQQPAPEKPQQGEKTGEKSDWGGSMPAIGGGHFPSLRPTTPRASRVVAFPHLTSGAADQDVHQGHAHGHAHGAQHGAHHGGGAQHGAHHHGGGGGGGHHHGDGGRKRGGGHHHGGDGGRGQSIYNSSHSLGHYYPKIHSGGGDDAGEGGAGGAGGGGGGEGFSQEHDERGGGMGGFGYANGGGTSTGSFPKMRELKLDDSKMQYGPNGRRKHGLAGFKKQPYASPYTKPLPQFALSSSRASNRSPVQGHDGDDGGGDGSGDSGDGGGDGAGDGAGGGAGGGGGGGALDGRGGDGPEDGGGAGYPEHGAGGDGPDDGGAGYPESGDGSAADGTMPSTRGYKPRTPVPSSSQYGVFGQASFPYAARHATRSVSRTGGGGGGFDFGHKGKVSKYSLQFGSSLGHHHKARYGGKRY